MEERLIIYREQAYIKEGKQYDINSLYPDSMLKNPMPLEVIKFHNNLDNIKLEDFFGFALTEIGRRNTERFRNTFTIL